MSQSFFQRLKIPHVFVLLTGVILLCSMLTYLIPSGSYQRKTIKVGPLERTVVIPGTYQEIPKHISPRSVLIGENPEGKATPVGLLKFLSAIPRGMEKSSDIIFFIFIIGGVLGVLQRTGMLNAIIQKLLDYFGDYKALLTIILMISIAIGGSTLGMGEEFIPLVPLFLIISKQMGYDRIYGLAIVLIAADIGFAAATTNPFTVNIANRIAELPLNNDINFRVIFLVCCLILIISYILRYGAKIQRNSSESFMTNDNFDISHYNFTKEDLKSSHVLIFLSCIIIFAIIISSVEALGWWMNEMSGGFLLMAFVAIFLSKLPLNEAAKAFVKGMEEMTVAALVVGFARGVEIVLEDGQILDTLIHFAASPLQTLPNFLAAEGMLLFQTCLNFLIPSGSGQAAVTMPIMTPLADVLNLSRQTAVFAFTCGDGFSNTLIPTSGFLMAMLSMAGIPYQKWLRFVLPLFLQLMLLSAIFLALSVIFPVVWEL